MAITIKLDTQAGKTAETLADIKDELKDVKAGAAEARSEFEKLKKGEEDQRRLAEQLAKVSNAFSSVTAAVKQHQASLARATEIHKQLVAQGSPLAQGFAKVADQIRRETEAAARAHEVHQRLIAQAHPLAQGFAQVAQQIGREEEMIRQIRGPLEDYTKDLATLDSLLEKNKISTKEYADQVSNLNRRLAEKPKESAPTMKTGASAIAGTLGLAAGPALAGSLLGVGKGIEELVRESDELEDKYTAMTNMALKFANNGKTVNQALAEQRDTARSIRAELGPTMELYDGIGDAMRNYGITAKDQTALTKLLGQEMIISNKPVAEAGSLMQRLSVAFELGEGRGRAFQQILRDHPKLADAAAQAFHTDINGLAQLVDAGKVGLPQLTKAWLDNGNAIRDEAEKRKRSNAELRRDFEEDIAYYEGKGFGSASVYMAGSKEMAAFNEKMREIKEGGKPMNEVLGAITSKVADQAAEWAQLEKEANSAKAALGVQGLMGAIDALNLGLGQFAQTMDKVGEKFSDSAFGRAMGHQQERARQMREAKLELKALSEEMKNGTLVSNEYQTRYEALMTTLNGGELPMTIKLWHMATDAQREYARELETLLKMNKAGAFTPEQFRGALAQVSSHKPVDPMDTFRGEVREAEQKKLAESMRKQREEIEKTKKESEAFAEQEKKLLEIYEMVQTPQEKVAEQLAELERLYKEGVITAELYAKAQKKVSEALGSNSKALTESWFARLKEYEDKTKETNQRVAESFGPIAEEIGKMAAGIETDWHGMIQKMLAELTKLIAMKALAAAFGGTGFGPAAGSIGSQLIGGVMSAFQGFDSGGQVVANGSPGSTDSQLVAFRKNPNETLTIHTPGQQANGMMNGSSSGAPPVQLKNVNVYDAKQAAYEALNSREGHELLMNWVAKNASYLKGYLQK